MIVICFTTYSLIIMLLPKASVSRTCCGRVHILSMYNTDNNNNAYNNNNNIHEPFRQDHKDALPRSISLSLEILNIKKGNIVSAACGPRVLFLTNSHFG